MNERIAYLRKNILNMSMEKFGERLNISRSAINQIEKAVNNPSEQTIKLICREFNVNEDWLRNGNEPIIKEVEIDFGKICAEIGLTDQKAVEGFTKYYRLSPEDKELFWKFIDRFVKD